MRKPIAACLLALLVAGGTRAESDPPLGRWRVEQIDFVDLGYCTMTEAVAADLTLDRRRDGQLFGTYVETFSREGDSGNCSGLGSFHARYGVSVAAPLPAIAHLRLEECRQFGRPSCAGLDQHLGKSLERAPDGNSLLLDGLRLERMPE